jgi:4-amino-4-deoxy-L-arabinose transferase-like glycosyltransferase
MSRAAAAPAIFLLLFLPVYFSGLDGLPFHPDETSLLFQSRDLELLLTDPRSMAWDEAKRGQADQQYRALNAPLAKYALGLGRRLAGHRPDEVGTDWDWSLSWEENQERGALPARSVLLPARLASTALAVAGLGLFYRSGKRVGGMPGGLLALLLVGLNALVLLHGRRAMSEGTLLFGVGLALWGILLGDRWPWLAGLGAALAFSAKHTALPLIPVGLLAAVWTTGPGGSGAALGRGSVRAAVYLATAALVVLALNPLLWSDPIGSGLDMVQARRALVQAQIQAQAAHSPVRLPMSATDSLASLIGQLYLTPLQFEELPNYSQESASAAAEYLRNPLNGLLRGEVLGVLLLGLTLVGILLGLTRLRRAQPAERRDLGLLLLATLLQALVLVITLPFPYQRYYLALLPLCMLWVGYALVQTAAQMKRLPRFRAA